MQSVSFTNRIGETLSGTLHRPNGKHGFGTDKMGFVMGHCFSCSRHTRILIDISSALSDIGLSVLRFDFSGNGKSEGVFEDSTYSKQIAEMMDAIKFMKQKDCDRILLGGHSMGGMVSLFTAAAREDIIGVIAFAPGSSTLNEKRLLTPAGIKNLSETGRVTFNSRGRDLVLTREFFDDAARYDVNEMINQIRCPVLAVLAANDTVLDPTAAKRIFSGGSGNIDLLEVEDADHMFSQSGHRQIIVDYITKWIETHF